MISMQERGNQFKNILITGDTGFIGRNLKNFLQKNCQEVSVSGFTRSKGRDIRNYNQILEAVKNKDLIINLAGTATIGYSWKNPRQAVDIDAYGATNVFKACDIAGIPVVHISSAEVYGTNLHPGHPMSENHPLHPRHPYGIAKKAAEIFAQKKIAQGQPIIILRLFTQYGDGSLEPLEQFIPRLIRNAISGKDLPIEGNGEIIRDWVFVSDTADAIWSSINAKPGFYNVCTGESFTQNQVATKILCEVKKHLKTKSRLVNLLHRQNFNEIKEQRGDPSRFFEETGWRAKTSLNDGIEKCIKFYLSV